MVFRLLSLSFRSLCSPDSGHFAEINDTAVILGKSLTKVWGEKVGLEIYGRQVEGQAVDTLSVTGQVAVQREGGTGEGGKREENRRMT